MSWNRHLIRPIGDAKASCRRDVGQDPNEASGATKFRPLAAEPGKRKDEAMNERTNEVGLPALAREQGAS